MSRGTSDYRRALLLAFGVALASGCDVELDSRHVAARRAFPQFQAEVYPVLLRDCGFEDCHGGSGRFLRIYGPGRARLISADLTPGAFDDPTGDEIGTTYSLALSQIDARDPLSSPLLRKPLAVEAGGSGHLGVDRFGRDVFRSKEDEGYRALLRWVQSPDPSQARMQAPAATP